MRPRVIYIYLYKITKGAFGVVCAKRYEVIPACNTWHYAKLSQDDSWRSFCVLLERKKEIRKKKKYNTAHVDAKPQCSLFPLLYEI